MTSTAPEERHKKNNNKRKSIKTMNFISDRQLALNPFRIAITQRYTLWLSTKHKTFIDRIINMISDCVRSNLDNFLTQNPLFIQEITSQKTLNASQFITKWIHKTQKLAITACKQFSTNEDPELGSLPWDDVLKQPSMKGMLFLSSSNSLLTNLKGCCRGDKDCSLMKATAVFQLLVWAFVGKECFHLVCGTLHIASLPRITQRELGESAQVPPDSVLWRWLICMSKCMNTSFDTCQQVVARHLGGTTLATHTATVVSSIFVERIMTSTFDLFITLGFDPLEVFDLPDTGTIPSPIPKPRDDYVAFVTMSFICFSMSKRGIISLDGLGSQGQCLSQSMVTIMSQTHTFYFPGRFYSHILTHYETAHTFLRNVTEPENSAHKCVTPINHDETKNQTPTSLKHPEMLTFEKKLNAFTDLLLDKSDLTHTLSDDEFTGLEASVDVIFDIHYIPFSMTFDDVNSIKHQILAVSILSHYMKERMKTTCELDELDEFDQTLYNFFHDSFEEETIDEENSPLSSIMLKLGKTMLRSFNFTSSIAEKLSVDENKKSDYLHDMKGRGKKSAIPPLMKDNSTRSTKEASYSDFSIPHSNFSTPHKKKREKLMWE
jgi:hypothetical protein